MQSTVVDARYLQQYENTFNNCIKYCTKILRSKAYSIASGFTENHQWAHKFAFYLTKCNIYDNS